MSGYENLQRESKATCRNDAKPRPFLLKQSFIKRTPTFRLRCVQTFHNFSNVISIRSRNMALTIEMMNEYGTPAVRITVDEASALLETHEIDAVIERLSLIRAAMRPEVPKEPSRTHQYVIEMDPCWHTEKHPLYDGAVLFMRHSGLGWAGFALPTSSLAKLNEALTNHLHTLELEEAHAVMN
jgi:hypothetical protein